MLTTLSTENYLNVDQNPWWLQDFDIKSLPEWDLTPRFALEHLKKLFYGTNLIIIVKGLRRLGKTTVIKHLIIDLLQKGVYAGKDIYFVEFSETTNDLNLVLKQVPTKSLLIVDEIQYCRRWKDLIKKSYDTYPQKRIIVTGSSSLNINRLDVDKKGEPLVGRFMPLTLKPLSFFEFLTLKYGVGFHTGLINHKEWEEYLFYGEFPETIKMVDREVKFEYLKKSVLEPVLTKDILFYDIEKKAEFYNFFTVLASNMCQQLKKSNISAEIGLSRKTLNKYLEVLVDLGLVVLLPNYYRSLRTSTLSLKKPLFASTNLALMSLSINDLSSPVLKDFYGHVFENALISNIMLSLGENTKYYYWRRMQKELDLVSFCNGTLTAWEVKAKDNIGNYALEMYKRYASTVGAKDFKLLDNQNFLDIISKLTISSG